MSDLRTRRHQETSNALVAAAFDLFAERRFAEVTMEEIAAAAGVSRSTAYRRFPTKEAIVLEVPRRWLAVFDAAAANAAVNAAGDHRSSLADILRAASLAVAQQIDEDPQLVLTAFGVLEQEPVLSLAAVATDAWLQRFAHLVVDHSDTDTETAMIISGSYLGAIDAMMRHWAATGGSSSVAASTKLLVERLASILP